MCIKKQYTNDIVKCKDIGILIKQNSQINCLYMLPSRTFRTRRKSLRTSYTHSYERASRFLRPEYTIENLKVIIISFRLR